MSSNGPLPSNPSLLAILFLIRTRTGPKFVCHYPPSPTLNWHNAQKSLRYPFSYKIDDDDDTTSGASSSSSDFDEHNSDTAQSVKRGSTRDGASRRTAKSTGSDPVESDDGDHGSSMNEEDEEDEEHDNSARLTKKDEPSVLGYSTGNLAKLLCPNSREWHREKFELTLETLVFLSSPIYAGRSGGWKKKKRRRRSSKLARALDENALQESQDDSETDHQLEFAELLRRRPSEGEISEKSTSTKDGSEEMTMFNVVFVMSPRQMEHQIRIKDMYENVTRTLAKALRYQQRTNGYVWNEARTILALKEKLKQTGAPPGELWPMIAASSSLAKALAITFDAISNSKIATLHLGPSLDFSVQIPQPISTRFAPTPTSKHTPGLPLTSFNASDHPTASSGPFDISPYSAILLLRSRGTLLKEIESDSSKELSASLAYLIGNSSPTKSLQKLTKICRLPLQDIQFLLRHLIHWRRARAIPPLHTTQTYIVSPNADFSRLSEASAIFSRHFAALPSLESMLGKIGRTPREYGIFIPSKDHKAAYMDILTWLIREGWVTQLRTFGWIRVSADVKAAVQEKIEEEEREAAVAAGAEEAGTEDENSSEEDYQERKSTVSARLVSSESRESKKSSVISPRLTAHFYPKRPSSDAGSVSSGRTAVPIPAATERLSGRMKSGLNVETSPQRPSSRQSSTIMSVIDSNVDGEPGAKTDHVNFSPSLILSPHKANTLESRWIDHIGNSLEDEDISKSWPSLIKYFDGKYALEEVATREGLKRKVVAGWLSTLIDLGILMVVRHW